MNDFNNNFNQNNNKTMQNLNTQIEQGKRENMRKATTEFQNAEAVPINPAVPKEFELPRNAKHEMKRQDLVKNVIKGGKEFKVQAKNNEIAMDNNISGNFHN